MKIFWAWGEWRFERDVRFFFTLWRIGPLRIRIGHRR